MKRTTRLSVLASVFVLSSLNTGAIAISAQVPQSARPSFEVASIKPNPPGETRVFMTGSGETYIATGMTLPRLIGYAYRVRDFQIIGATGWMTSDRWEISAKSPEGSISSARSTADPNVPDPSALMLQSLLEDRFKLRIHRETREQPVYELAVAKGGPKIKLSEDQGPIEQIPLEAIRSGVLNRKMPRGSYSTASGRFDATAISLDRFIGFLVPHLDGPVNDKTGLEGLYDFSLRYAQQPGTFAFASPDIPVDDLSGPSIYTALREQLGLQLNRGKGPVEVIVIDSAQKPTPN
jgi:uncharacterized protein (TIGR03435 family)